MWEARATYEDGTEVCKYFPYNENGNYTAECERQYELEEWLLGYHDGCTWYSVTYVEEF
jgi:hypothetical protein